MVLIAEVLRAIYIATMCYAFEYKMLNITDVF